MTAYTATITNAEGLPLIVGTTKDGAAPTFIPTPIADDVLGPGVSGVYALLGDLDRAYAFGIYAVGPAGEVRDMVVAMGQASEKHRLTLEVPPETQAKVDAEAAAWAAVMGPGMVP